MAYTPGTYVSPFLTAPALQSPWLAGIQTIFTGKNVTEFLDDLEVLGMRAEWSDQDMIVNFLHHTAPKIDREVRDAIPDNWCWLAFRERVARVFACDETSYSIDDLKKMKKQEDESLVAFARRYEKASNPLVGGFMGEIERCGIFLGFLSREKRDKIMRDLPSRVVFGQVKLLVHNTEGQSAKSHLARILDNLGKEVTADNGGGRPHYEDRRPRIEGRDLGTGSPRRGESVRGDSDWKKGGRGDRKMNDGERGTSSKWSNIKDSRWKPNEEIEVRRSERREEEMVKQIKILKAAVEKLQSSSQRKEETPTRSAPRTENHGDPSLKRTWNSKTCIYCADEDHQKRDCRAMMEALTEDIIELDDRKYGMWADEGKPVPFLPSMKINVDIRRRRMNEAKGKQEQEPAGAKVSRVAFEEDLDELPESPGMRISSIKFEETEDNDEVYVCTQGVGESSKGKKEDRDQPMTDEQVESPKSPQSPRKKGAKKFHLKSSLDEVNLRGPLRRVMNMPIPITLKELIVSCGSARGELIEMMKKAKVPLAEATASSEPKIEMKTSVLVAEKGEVGHVEINDDGDDYFYVLGSGKLNAIVNGIRMESIVDDGSESTVYEDKVTRKLGLEVDRSVAMTMVSANKLKQLALGVCHKAKVVAAGVGVTVPVFTVEHCSSELILGRTWLTRVNATTENKRDGSQTVTINGPDGSKVTLKTVNEFDKRHKVSLQNRRVVKTKKLSDDSRRSRSWAS
ncbi:hypothetical protein CBR_g48975 [Chara braunii]|uniref:CCHC-type domain-containing protein n=1 Tax=Chara braunii TaxID=69332 RepID=A0A388M400_CHABU|nr:hypothetical protein CBR_g48975 [Chara braunii]|eukprot:GBG89266.1 hypothetical protein CBR_g48975 [Chara braunii]